MCGIVYGHGQKKLKQKVWKQYMRQRSRGTDGFGVFDGRHVTKSATEKRIKRWFKRQEANPEMLLFHHRWPTSTENTRRTAHPFHTGDYFGDTRYIMVHNGTISNHRSLKADHEKIGIKYSSVTVDGGYNDSEALLWDFALVLQGEKSSLNAYGDIAFICVELEKGEVTKLHFGRNYGRPLKMRRNNKAMMLASEGAGTDVDTNKLYTYNYKLNRLTDKYFRVPASNYSYDWSTVQNKYSRSKGSDTSVGKTYYVPVSDDDGYYIDDNGYAVYPDEDIVSCSTTFTNKGGTALDLKKEPEEGEVNAEFFRLLAQEDGYYDEAHRNGIAELAFLEECRADMTTKELEGMEVLRAACQLLLQDPYWTDEDSVHPMWIPGNHESIEEDPEAAEERQLMLLAQEVA